MKKIYVFAVSLLTAAALAGLTAGCEKKINDNNNLMLILLGLVGWDTTYSVTFNSQGGSAVDSQLIDHGGLVTEPADPTRTGYTFRGWFEEEECLNEWNFSGNTVTGNITLFAKWSCNHGIAVSVGIEELPSDGLFDFGEVANTLSYQRTFKITNTGSVTITISSVVKSSGDTDYFSINTTLMASTLTAGSATNFTIYFNPAFDSDSLGEKNALVSIAYSPSEEPYAFTVRGTSAGCIDNDGDGYGDGTECLGTDCMDTDPSIYPGATEICGNYLDDDCDEDIDEGCPLP